MQICISPPLAYFLKKEGSAGEGGAKMGFAGSCRLADALEHILPEPAKERTWVAFKQPKRQAHSDDKEDKKPSSPGDFLS